jgi:hypothetical protein
MEQLKKGPMSSFICSYVNVHTNNFFFVVLFRKGPKFLLPLYVHSCGTDEIWISQMERKPKLIPSYVGKVSCREFRHPFLRNRSRWCPDVQIWSRFGPDFAVQTVWTNFGNHPGLSYAQICPAKKKRWTAPKNLKGSPVLSPSHSIALSRYSHKIYHF